VNSNTFSASAVSENLFGAGTSQENDMTKCKLPSASFSATWRAAALALVAGAMTAVATPASAQDVTLYSSTYFGGESFTVGGDLESLGAFRFNDRARSIRIERGRWEVCEHDNYSGRCIELDGPVSDLSEIGLSSRISSIRRSRGGAGGGTRPTLILYSQPGFRGQEVRLDGVINTLNDRGFNDRARSARVIGNWTLCSDANLRGRCVDVGGDIFDLAQLNLSDAISSAQPSWSNPGPGRPTPGGPGPGRPDLGRVDRPNAEGRSSAFFRNPRVSGSAVDLCLDRAGRQCGSVAADRFCEIAGYAEAAWLGFDTPGYTPRTEGRSDTSEPQFFPPDLKGGSTIHLGDRELCSGRSCRPLEDVLCIK